MLSGKLSYINGSEESLFREGLLGKVTVTFMVVAAGWNSRTLGLDRFGSGVPHPCSPHRMAIWGWQREGVAPHL